jgi:hypothetical protein
MLTREQIVENLRKNADWEPDEDAPDQVWDLYDEVYQWLDERGELGADAKEEEPKEKTESGEDDDDTDLSDNDFDDDDWLDDEYDEE